MESTATVAQPIPPHAVIMQMALGGWVAKAVSDVSRLGIPDALHTSGPLTAAELVARGVAAKPEFLERALRLLASLGIFTEDRDGRFGATALSEPLTSTSATSVKGFVDLTCAPWFWKCWAGLGDALRTGEPQPRHQIGLDFWDYLQANPKDLAEFGESMKSGSLNSLRGVLQFCDFSGVRTVADVGGGFGHLAVALLGKYENLHATVMDVPHLIPVAKQNLIIEDPLVASRLDYVGGDMFESVPAAEVYVMKHIVHDWDDARCIRLLENCRNSIVGAGRVICVDAVIPPLGDTGGTAAKLMDLNMMVLVPGKERTLDQWKSLYDAAGLRISAVTPIQDDFGTSIIEGHKK